MSSVALKILKKQTEGKLKKKNTNAENPYYEWVQVEKRNGRFKTERQERPLPQGLSANDRKILKHVRKRAYRLDMGFRLCCFNFRFGWSAIIGLLPVIGDALEVMMALSLIKTAAKVDGGLPKRLYSMMFANIMLDLAVGFVPILGDLVDFWYRANTRNAWLLDAYLTAKAEAIRKNVIIDPDTGEKVPVPPELLGDPTDRDVEQGVVEVQMAQTSRVTPAVAPPAPKPAPKMYNAPPGRNLTGQAAAGRQVQDPRDKKGRR